MQRPYMRHNIAPGGDLDLHAQAGQGTAHIDDGLLQRQVLAFDPGAACACGITHQQRLGIFIDIVHGFDLKLGAGLHYLLYRATINCAQNALAVLVGDIVRQLDLDLEDLVVTVFRVDDVVL